MAGEAGFEPTQRESKSRGLPISRFPTGASGRCRPGFLPLTRRLRCRCATEAKCPRQDLNLRCTAPQTVASAAGLRGLEPPPGADPGHPPYEGGAAAVRGGEAAGQGLEPRFAASEAAVLPLDDPAMVGEEGLEPSSGCFWGRPLFRWRTRPQCAASDSNREPPD